MKTHKHRIIVKIYVMLGYLSIFPVSGPGGATVEFTGSEYPASSTVDLYYYDSSLVKMELLDINNFQRLWHNPV